MRIIAPLICLSILCYSGGSRHWNKDPNEFADYYLSKLRKLLTEIQDINQNLTSTKNTASEFFKESVLLMELISDKDGDNAKALKTVVDGIKSTWEELWNTRGYPMFKSEAMDDEWREITKKKGSSLQRLLDTVPKLMNETDWFTGECEDLPNLPEYLRNRVTRGCHLNNTEVYMKLGSLFSRMRKQLIRHITNEMAHLPVEKLLDKEGEAEIAVLINSLPVEEAIHLLDIIEREFHEFSIILGSDFLTDVAEFIFNNRSTQNPIKECLTDDVFNGNLYNRSSVMSFVTHIQRDLSKLIITSPLCGYMRFQSDPQRLEKYLKETDEDIMTTFQFIAEYIPRKMRDSPLGIEEIVVRNAIRDFDVGNALQPDKKSDIPLTNMPALFEVINNALQDIGSDRIQKQIVVAPANSTEFSTFFICPTYWCSTVLNQRGVDVIIARFPIENLHLAPALHNRTETTRLLMFDFLKENYWLPLPQLVEEFENETNVILTNELARSVAIIRHKTFVSVDCKFQELFYLHRDNVSNVTATSHFTYGNLFDKWWFHDNTCYSFYFFL